MPKPDTTTPRTQYGIAPNTQHGNWYVIRRVAVGRRAHWLCACVCGQLRAASSTEVRGLHPGNRHCRCTDRKRLGWDVARGLRQSSEHRTTVRLAVSRARAAGVADELYALVMPARLRDGRTKSGTAAGVIIRKEKAGPVVVGCTYGHLTVREWRTGNKGINRGISTWLCCCSCGQLRLASTRRLTNLVASNERNKQRAYCDCSPLKCYDWNVELGLETTGEQERAAHLRQLREMRAADKWETERQGSLAAGRELRAGLKEEKLKEEKRLRRSPAKASPAEKQRAFELFLLSPRSPAKPLA